MFYVCQSSQEVMSVDLMSYLCKINIIIIINIITLISIVQNIRLCKSKLYGFKIKYVKDKFCTLIKNELLLINCEAEAIIGSCNSKCPML